MTQRAAGLPRSTWVAYGLPSVGSGFMLFLVSLWFLKFATDVLRLAPAAVAVLFAAARIWDAVIDPLAGWVSDRTRTRFGRRRPYMAVGALALPVSFYALFNPPGGMPEPALLAWVAVGLVVVYTASTLFLVPHQALGAELSDAPHERSWLFGLHYVGWQVGAFAAMATLAGVENADDPRAVLGLVTLPLAVLSALLMAGATWRLREPPGHVGRGGRSLLRAFADVWRNPHARPLMIAFFIDAIGVAGVGILAPYVADYLLGGPEMLLYFFAFYAVPAVFFAPLWPGLGRRLGKKRLWVASLCVSAAGFGSFFFLQEGQLVLLCGVAVFIGLAGSCAQVMVPSMLADVMDWDEWSTGERKEGAYSATRTFLFKAAFGVMVLLVGTTLDRVGYVPDGEQSETALFALRVLFSVVPAGFYLASMAYVVPFFRFGEADHARIRAALDARERP